MRTYTVREAAAAAGCAPATVARLKRKGLLEGGRGFVKAPNRQAIAETVEEATKGRHGWKWRPREHGPRWHKAVDASAEKIYQQLWPTEFPPARRELLLTLANHYADAELQLLVELRSPRAMRLMAEFLRPKG